MAAHGTATEYKNGCRCEGCREANRIYQADYRADYRAGHRRSRVSRAEQPTCVLCDRRIVGIPTGWKHLDDNRERGDDGHVATPRSAA